MWEWKHTQLEELSSEFRSIHPKGHDPPQTVKREWIKQLQKIHPNIPTAAQIYHKYWKLNKEVWNKKVLLPPLMHDISYYLWFNIVSLLPSIPRCTQSNSIYVQLKRMASMGTHVDMNIKYLRRAQQEMRQFEQQLRHS